MTALLLFDRSFDCCFFVVCVCVCVLYILCLLVYCVFCIYIMFIVCVCACVNNLFSLYLYLLRVSTIYTSHIWAKAYLILGFYMNIRGRLQQSFRNFKFWILENSKT